VYGLRPAWRVFDDAGAILYLYAGGEALFACRGAQARQKLSRVPSATRGGLPLSGLTDTLGISRPIDEIFSHGKSQRSFAEIQRITRGRDALLSIRVLGEDLGLT
jgi:hypothetical protein